MIEYAGKDYELTYGLRRIEMIENAINAPVMTTIAHTRGLFRISDLRAFLVLGLKEQEGGYVANKLATEIADSLIDASYSEACALVLEALERDCPFMFR